MLGSEKNPFRLKMKVELKYNPD